MKPPNEPSRLEKGHHMPTHQATECEPSRSKRTSRRPRLMLAGAAALVTVVVAVAGCGGGYGGSSSPSTSAPSASAQKGGSADSGTPSSTSGIPQNNGGDHDADNNGGPSDGDGNV